MKVWHKNWLQGEDDCEGCPFSKPMGSRDSKTTNGKQGFKNRYQVQNRSDTGLTGYHENQ
jgi:hypothetical protein